MISGTYLVLHYLLPLSLFSDIISNFRFLISIYQLHHRSILLLTKMIVIWRQWSRNIVIWRRMSWKGGLTSAIGSLLLQTTSHHGWRGQFHFGDLEVEQPGSLQIVISILTPRTLALIRAQKTIFEAIAVHFEAACTFALARLTRLWRLELWSLLLWRLSISISIFSCSWARRWSINQLSSFL